MHITNTRVVKSNIISILMASSFIFGNSGLRATNSAGLARGEEATPAAIVALENSLLRVAVDRRNGNLLRLEDLQAPFPHFNLVEDSTSIGRLWELELTLSGKKLVLGAEDAREFHCQPTANGGPGLRLRWSRFKSAAASECTVEIAIDLAAGEPTSHWRITVDKPANLALDKIYFPRLDGIRRQPDERLAVPVWMGQLLANPRNKLAGTNGRGGRMAWSYPGRLSMQCLAWYRQGGCGLYVACDDNRAAHKTFVLQGQPTGDVQFEMVHYPEGRAAQEGHYVLPYRVALGTVHGDWITAAERYRTWAVKQPWARQSRLRQGLVPDWVMKTGLWIWNRGRSPGVLPPASAMQDRLGLPVSVFWHWWHGCPYDIGFPEYLPPREGTKSFRQAVAHAHDQGLRMLVYMNQRAWGMSSASWKAEGAEQFAVKGPNGKVRPEIYNTFTRQALASMCLATPFWRNKYAGLAEEVVNDLGVDGIYMDQACSHQACYDPAHPHPLGGGSSWTEGFRKLAKDIRERTGEDRPVVLAGEGCGEAWLPRLDLMLALQVSMERYRSIGDAWEVIPFFHAVYHQHAVIYGNYSSLTMPPYDDLWPAKYAPAERLALLDRKYSRQFYLEQARTFVWGQQPTLANFQEAHLEERPEEIGYLVRLARVRNRASKYLLHGQFLRPPELNVPKATSDFSRLSIYAGQQDRLTSFQKEHPLALAGAWRAPDGNLAIALASVADHPLLLNCALDAEAYQLPNQRRITRIDADGRQPMEISENSSSVGNDGKDGTNGIELSIELPPRAVWVIEISASDDSGS